MFLSTLSGFTALAVSETDQQVRVVDPAILAADDDFSAIDTPRAAVEDDPWDAHERGLDVPEWKRDPDHPRPDVAPIPEGLAELIELEGDPDHPRPEAPPVPEGGKVHVGPEGATYIELTNGTLIGPDGEVVKGADGTPITVPKEDVDAAPAPSPETGVPSDDDRRRTGISVPHAYIGCFVDDSNRDLEEGPKQYGYDPSSCAVACKGYKYFALQNNGWCVCGNAYATGFQYAKVADSDCGASRLGGPWRNAVYQLTGGDSTASGSEYICATRENDYCECSGTVYYGKKFLSGRPGAGATTNFAQLVNGPHKTKQSTTKVKCSYHDMGGDPTRGYYKWCYCDPTAAPRCSIDHADGLNGISGTACPEATPYCVGWVRDVSWGKCYAEPAFTMIFLADVEARYRGHGPEQVKRVVKFVRDIGDKNLRFDTSNHKIEKPSLVIHGGDLNADCWRSCSKWPHVVATYPDDDFDEFWNMLYDAGIPMISNFGNHDWETHRNPRRFLKGAYSDITFHGSYKCREYTVGGTWTDETKEFFDAFPASRIDESNRKSVEFVRKTFEKAARTSSDFTYKRFSSARDGEIRADMYSAEFRGVQIAMFMNSALNPYYNENNKQEIIDDQETFDKMTSQLDRSKHTMFVSHYPIIDQTCKEGKLLTELIEEFPGYRTSQSAHFSGHDHIPSMDKWNGIRDYVAPYPYKWGNREKGALYAVLAHPTEGILEVKEVEIQKDCWKPGTTCLAGTTCNWNCCDNENDWEHWYSEGITKCGKEPRWGKGTYCFKGTSCNRCQEGQDATWWYGKQPNGYYCGTEDKWEDGELCALGTSCNRCKNTATWWHGTTPVGYHCGKETKWADGTYCLKGTSCNICKNKATWWYNKHPNGYRCGTDTHKWGDGTYCLAGTSCNQCRNTATWWYSIHPNGMRCGTDNFWGDGTYCLAGTTCKQCRNTATWWYGKHPNGMYCGNEPCWKRDTSCYLASCDKCCGGAWKPWYWFGGGQCN